jgi:hypothetical protein
MMASCGPSKFCYWCKFKRWCYNPSSLPCSLLMQLNLGVGIIPSLNIAAGLLAFCSLKGWQLLAKRVWPHEPVRPFGAQVWNKSSFNDVHIRTKAGVADMTGLVLIMCTCEQKLVCQCDVSRVGQNHLGIYVYTPYIIVCLIKSLQKIPSVTLYFYGCGQL